MGERELQWPVRSVRIWRKEQGVLLESDGLCGTIRMVARECTCAAGDARPEVLGAILTI